MPNSRGVPSEQLRWISSAGGPLVMLPGSYLKQWQGVQNKSSGVSDYELACKAASFADNIQWRGIELLVFGDEPMATCVVDHDKMPLIARWRHAPDDVSAVRALTSAQVGNMVPIEHVRLRVVEPEQVIFDSGTPGPRVKDRLELTLKSGLYVVRTFCYEPSREMAFILHTFEQPAN
jgi:hypothetical protein